MHDLLATLRTLIAGASGTGGAVAGAHPLRAGEGIAASPARLARYAGGRAAAHLAMAQIGLPPRALPVGPNGAPVWPGGVSGSITHCADLSLAAVVTEGTIGIDLEAAEPLGHDRADIVLLPQERAEIGIRRDLAMQMLAAKRAVYKAQYPLSHTVFGFETLLITLHPGGFAARFRKDVGPFHAGALLEGRQDMVGDHLLTVVQAGLRT